MKKKKIQFDKKLTFSKTTISELNPDQQLLLAGGGTNVLTECVIPLKTMIQTCFVICRQNTLNIQQCISYRITPGCN